MSGKLISKQSGKLLSWFNQQNQACFTFTEAAMALPESGEGAIRELLSDMTRRGLLLRIKRGVYYIIPYEEDADSFMPDWHLIAEKLVNGKEHYIGYYSALQIHELITQPSIKEQIVVAEQIRPSVIHVKTIPFQFIYHNANHFFGAKKTWIDSYHKVNCSDLEKTLIDCLFKPGYAGGIVEIAKAIHLSRNQIQNDKILDYVGRFRSQVVIKRLGFLLELLEVATPVLDKLREMKTDSYEVLDPELPRKGKHSRRWSIQQNLENETITSALYT